MPYSVEASIKAKGITRENYPWRTDEMTDEEITYMLKLDEGEANYRELHKAHPKTVDREYVEFMRDF